MFAPLLDKTAEPPPPEGVSVGEWDKILQKGPAMTKKKVASVPLSAIRHFAELDREKRAFEELTAPLPIPTEEIILQQKLACVADEELFKTAFFLTENTEQALATYEQLGGTYVVKHAFGQQMFDAKQMAGSPAVSGGMSARAKTPMPQMQQAPVSVTTTSIGQTSNSQGGASAPSSTSQTSTPSAPTG